jgi:hypothetical protein
MTDKICYWDAKAGKQKERDATPEEQAEIDARRSAPPSKASINEPIIAEIAQLDLKRIRPLAEGDSAYLATLNAQIAALRAKLVK